MFFFPVDYKELEYSNIILFVASTHSGTAIILSHQETHENCKREMLDYQKKMLYSSTLTFIHASLQCDFTGLPARGRTYSSVFASELYLLWPQNMAGMMLYQFWAYFSRGPACLLLSRNPPSHRVNWQRLACCVLKDSFSIVPDTSAKKQPSLRSRACSLTRSWPQVHWGTKLSTEVLTHRAGS